MTIPTPTPDDKFTFGLWTVGNPGRDPMQISFIDNTDPDGIARTRTGVCSRPAGADCLYRTPDRPDSHARQSPGASTRL